MYLLILVHILRISVAEECSWSWIGESVERAKHCGDNCYLSRERVRNGTSCNHGPIIEDIINCAISSNSFCPDFALLKTNEQCRGTCDRALEQVTLQCVSNSNCTKIQTRYCTVEANCNGEWSQWAYNEGCNVGRSLQRRTRQCLHRETNVSTTHCKGSRGKRKQFEMVQCATSSTPSNNDLSGRALPTSDSESICRSHCSNIDEVISYQNLYSSCDTAVMKDNNLQESTCDNIHGFVVSCTGIPEERKCALAENMVFCEQFRNWSSWQTWSSEKNVNNEYRIRHRWCIKPLHQFSDALPCQMPLQVEKQCVINTADNVKTGFVLEVWMIAAISGFVGMVIIVVMLICWCRRNKQRKSKTQYDKSKTKKNSEFQTENGKLLKPNTLQVDNSDRSTVLNRLSQVSEHMYEAIHGRASRSLSSNCDSNQPVRKLKDDVFKLHRDDEDEQEGSPRKYSCKIKRLKSCDPLRISFTVTDPEGIEVGKNVFKTSVLKQESNPGRSRWSRVPTPEPTSSSKFFTNSLTVKYYDNQLRVPSVRYGLPTTKDDSSKHPQFLNKERNLSLTKELQIHQYDEVPHDRFYLASARSSLMIDDDDASVWSQSSFDDEDECSSMCSSRQYSPLSKKVLLADNVYQSPLKLKLNKLDGGTTLLLPRSGITDGEKYMEMSPQIVNLSSNKKQSTGPSQLLRHDARLKTVAALSTREPNVQNSPKYDLPKIPAKRLTKKNSSLPTDTLGYACLDV